jgi:hypothetical protein
VIEPELAQDALLFGPIGEIGQSTVRVEHQVRMRIEGDAETGQLELIGAFDDPPEEHLVATVDTVERADCGDHGGAMSHRATRTKVWVATGMP